VPPIVVLAGGTAFGTMIPLFVCGLIGATALMGAAALVGALAGAGTCRAIDHSARARFLREHARALPPARIIRRGYRRHVSVR